MTGYTDTVEKALFLRRFGVPFWGLTYVFGRSDMYWYRIVEHLGRFDLVGTTVKSGAKLPNICWRTKSSPTCWATNVVSL